MIEKDCENCPLGKQSVCIPFVHNPKAKYLAVIESSLKAENFKSYWETEEGRLLKNVFASCNITTQEIQLAKAIDCSVPSTTKAAVIKKAAEHCNGHLKLPEVVGNYEAVIAFGNVSSQLLTGETGVTKLRVGPPKQWQGTQLIRTVSPRSCMVAERNFPFLVTDIGKIGVQPIEWKDPEYRVVSTPQDALEYLCSIIDYQFVTIDIETATEKDLSFEHPDKYEMLCIGMKVAEGPVVVLAKEALNEEVYAKLKDRLKYSYIIAHNGKFDLNGLRPHVGKLNLCADTMLMSYVLDERSGIHSLDYLGQEFLGAPDWKKELHPWTKGKNMKNVPPPVLHLYNARDVEVTKQLFDYFQYKIIKKDNGLMQLHNFLVNASNMLGDVESHGFYIDQDKLNKAKKEYDEREAKMLEDLVVFVLRNVGYTDPKLGFNPRSPVQVKRVIKLLGVNVESTDEDSLINVIDNSDVASAVEFCEKLLEYRKLQKLIGTYINGIKDRIHNGKIHANFLLHGTTSGRLSCRNPNIQTIPRDSIIKEFFVASPGKVLIHADYSQAELRVLSWLAKDKFFTPIFNDGTRDVFDELVPELFDGIQKETTDPHEWKEKRVMVKGYVYGLAYGRTEYGLARGFKIPVEEARKHMKKFFSTIPEIINWQRQTEKDTLKGVVLTTPQGRRRRFNLVTRLNKDKVENEALSFLPQSIASDMTLLAAIELNNDPNFTAKIVNIVHDDIIAESDPEDAEKNLEMIKEAMLRSAHGIVGDYVKFAVDGSIGEVWGLMK